MKIYFAPDTSDHPNWGCRVMGACFREAFARLGMPPTWRTPASGSIGSCVKQGIKT